MRNFYKLIEILLSLQLLIISTMINVYNPLAFLDKSKYSLDIPITLQIPTIILLTLTFDRKVVFTAFSFYLFLGLFFLPVFNHGGSIGYLLTPNFGYLLGSYPLIKIIDNLNKKSNVRVKNFIINGLLAVFALHLTGILYNLIQTIFYGQFTIFLYNIGKYSASKIWYHIILLIPLTFLFKPIMYFKYKN